MPFVKIYTGPCGVEEVAAQVEELGAVKAFAGTQHVWLNVADEPTFLAWADKLFKGYRERFGRRFPYDVYGPLFVAKRYNEE
jgi:hypothetical protein